MSLYLGGVPWLPWKGVYIYGGAFPPSFEDFKPDTSSIVHIPYYSLD